MNIPEESICNYPNVAIEAGSNPTEVMRKHCVEPPFGTSEGPSSPNMDSCAGKAWNKAGKPATGPLRLMRECGGMEHGMGSLRKALGVECVSGWQMKCLKTLADMVDRDYVKRDVVDDDAYMRGLMAGRASLDDEFAELITERDEWKAKAEGFTEALEKLGCSVLANGTVFEGSSNRAGSGKRAAAVERLRHFTSWDECDGYGYYWDVTRALLGESPVEYTSEELLSALIDLLEDAPMDAGLDDDGTSPNDRATEHVTNLEWLYEHDDAFAYGAKKFVVDDGYSCCETLDQAHEWLMAPHEGARSKVQAKTEPILTEQPESLSDESCRQYADQGERAESPDCESDSREKLCTLDVYEDGKLHSSTDIPKPGWEHDSREKLEADFSAAFREVYDLGFAFGEIAPSERDSEAQKCSYNYRLTDYLDLLDRQAAITKRECDRPNRDERDKAEARVAELESTISALKELLLEVPVDSIAASKLEGGL